MTPEETLDGISPKQQLALEILLVGGTDQQAADAADVTRTTVTGWRNQHDGFRKAFTVARRELHRRAMARLRASSSLAARALEDVVKDTRFPAARVSAARAILGINQNAYELEDIEQQIEELRRDREENGAAHDGNAPKA